MHEPWLRQGASSLSPKDWIAEIVLPATLSVEGGLRDGRSESGLLATLATSIFYFWVA